MKRKGLLLIALWLFSSGCATIRVRRAGIYSGKSKELIPQTAYVTADGTVAIEARYFDHGQTTTKWLSVSRQTLVGALRPGDGIYEMNFPVNVDLSVWKE